MRLLGLVILLLFSVAAGAGLAAAQDEPPQNGWKNWAVGILAADWRDSNGGTIEAFDNARKDLAAAFSAAGFSADNITQLSLRPNLLTGLKLSSKDAFAAFAEQAEAANDGCLMYFTSHGNTDGIVLGNEGMLKPERLDGLLDVWCGERPTIVVISACHSGVFLPVVSAPNRMVMTAARPDRTSFGCGAGERYPYFDACIIESLPAADDFIHLASLARRCVALRERQTFSWPPSEPLTKVGDDVEDLFIFQNFVHSEAATGG